MSQLLQVATRGGITVSDDTASPSYFDQGIPYDDDALLAIDSAGAIDHYHQGLPFTLEGRLATSTETVQRIGSGTVPFDAAGRIVFDGEGVVRVATGVPFSLIGAIGAEGVQPAAPTDFLAFWKMDLVDGDKVLDESGNGYTMDSIDGFAPNYVAGVDVITTAIEGVSTNQGLRLNGFHAAFAYTEVSITFWIKGSGVVGTGDDAWLWGNTTLFASAKGEGVVIRNSDNALNFYINGLGKMTATDNTTTILDGTWHHIACTFGVVEPFGNANIYVDGVHTKLQSGNGNRLEHSTATPQPLILQRGLGETNGFQGTVDELKIWNRELSAEEVEQVFNEITPP